MSEKTISPITTHVLDISLGKPASGVPVALEIEEIGTGWKQLGRGETDKDGRVRDLIGEGALVEGTYRLTFDTHTYFADRKLEALYPQVSVVFSVRQTTQHYHIPLLLGPFGYSTYRGS
jgi:5-hydroxyisourate hydrolase